MRKFTLGFMLFMMSLTVVPSAVHAETNDIESGITTTPNEVPAEVKVMYDRLEEIKKIDKSELSRSEKKALRKEVKAIKSELRSKGNGVYLSVGAIIIIILLLILLL